MKKYARKSKRHHSSAEHSSTKAVSQSEVVAGASKKASSSRAWSSWHACCIWGPVSGIVGACILTTLQLSNRLSVSAAHESEGKEVQKAPSSHLRASALPSLVRSNDPASDLRLQTTLPQAVSAPAPPAAVPEGQKGSVASQPSIPGFLVPPEMPPERVSQHASSDASTCTTRNGYANNLIADGTEEYGVRTPEQCSKRCSVQPTCTCWSWKDDGYCRMGAASSCFHVGSPDDERWKFGQCSRDGVAVQHEPPRASVLFPARDALPRADLIASSSTCDVAAVAKASEESAELGEGSAGAEILPVIIIAHARPDYLRRVLASVFQHRVQVDKFPVFASQDGNHAEVESILQEALRLGNLKQHLRFRPPEQLLRGPYTPRKGYERLAAHYRWALDQMFLNLGYGQLIVLEDDLEIAPDFFSYFEATLPLLRSDPCLFCVSAWNDNGLGELASDSSALYRSDFFSGLGWMLLRRFWLEIRVRWPKTYWDEFVRNADVRRGRQCLRPEVSRTHTFGEIGVSNGEFYHTHLERMVLNHDMVDWKAKDLGFVATSAAFDEYLAGQMRGADILSLEDMSDIGTDATSDSRPLVVRYKDHSWKRYANFFGLMEDEKAGIRRGTYRGVLPFTWRGRRVFLVRDWPFA
eukprot:TRINITY_DN47771_c0_g1_i1.p1 TRINITY_DN47771_c0_g1~~TRINITY_DN47771_c0_g1_i1.p1  ORF type:complete len:638 (-),score=60.79 TRINITY_DN47771_c0_g1_i1:339-2252(-)